VIKWQPSTRAETKCVFKKLRWHINKKSRHTESSATESSSSWMRSSTPSLSATSPVCASASLIGPKSIVRPSAAPTRFNAVSTSLTYDSRQQVASSNDWCCLESADDDVGRDSSSVPSASFASSDDDNAFLHTPSHSTAARNSITWPEPCHVPASITITDISSGNPARSGVVST